MRLHTTQSGVTKYSQWRLHHIPVRSSLSWNMQWHVINVITCDTWPCYNGTHISMAWCKIAMSPVYQQWRYCSLPLSHQCNSVRYHSVGSVTESRGISHHVETSFVVVWLGCVTISFTDIIQDYFNGLVQDRSISSVLAIKILQSCTKPSTWRHWRNHVIASKPGFFQGSFSGPGIIKWLPLCQRN